MKIVSKGHFSRNRFHMARKRYPRWVRCSTRIFYLPLLFGRMMLPHTDFDKYIFEESQLFTLLWLFLLIFEVFFKFFVSSSIWIHMLTGSTNYKVENGFHNWNMLSKSYLLLFGRAMPPFTCLTRKFHFSTTSTTRISSQTLIIYTNQIRIL